MKIEKVSKANPLPTLLVLQKYLEDWMKNTKMSSVQLDGSNDYSNNPAAWLFFIYDGRLWRLHGDTRDLAVAEFIKNGKLTMATNSKGKEVLRLPSSPGEAKGWYCYAV
jgi:hypothetical protein